MDLKCLLLKKWFVLDSRSSNHSPYLQWLPSPTSWAPGLAVLEGKDFVQRFLNGMRKGALLALSPSCRIFQNFPDVSKFRKHFNNWKLCLVEVGGGGGLKLTGPPLKKVPGSLAGICTHRSRLCSSLGASRAGSHPPVSSLWPMH